MKRWSVPKDQRQLRQSVLFLRTSFEAMQHSIAPRLEDPLPCWLDTGTLSMLAGELARVSEEATSVLPFDAHAKLCLASNQCELLLKQCPGVLSSAFCHRQLGAIVLTLNAALLSAAAPAPKKRWFWSS
ncbi:MULTISPECIES: hypothetical protein [unclassified Halomonas]|uniref:hypothetical protein n=1 Tax=unclassified Halomonas TaxID=2609666 RepID=UPI0020767150|nr:MULTISPECIES: hypothetical protein [unclassified Halomonas]